MTTDHALVVADDLTGATDTGHSFAARGYETVVRIDPDFDAPEAVVLVVDTDSRYVDRDEAVTRVQDVAASTEAAVVYKKVDSTLRGNLGAEIVAVYDAMDADAATVAPAFPSNDRLTAGGYHLVDGELVTNTEAGKDPDSPIETSHIPHLLRTQIDDPIAHADVECVASRSAAKKLHRSNESMGDERRIVVFDVVHDSHLDIIAEAAHEYDGDVLLVGSAGLAEAVRLPCEPTAERLTLTDSPTATAFGIVGSVNPQTLTQLDVLSQNRVINLDTTVAVHDPAAAAAAAADKCLERFNTESAVVLASARDHSDIEATLDAANRASIPERKAREHVTSALGTAAAQVWEASEPDGLFLTGGSVAKAVLGRLDAGGIALRGEGISVGVPAGEVRGGPANGTPIVTKAGAFGDDSTIIDAINYLRRTPERSK
ncbi:four-carbon acid sugar kinase family protein [Haladaptatus halobius]|uniref:four-carbon acid sugar kinase family protein n=1 Tax=Haladaptatus halobius TaxID=2884875 RepID=UPI001D0B03F2|nr:four-carbon acid sugar kinase family protein [Haladaptatus halobius]